MLPWRGYLIIPSPFIFSLINSFHHLSLSLALLSSLWPNPQREPPATTSAWSHHRPATLAPPCATTSPEPLSLSPLFRPPTEPTPLGRSDQAKAGHHQVLSSFDSNRRFYSRVRFDLGSKEIRTSIRNLYLFDQV